MLPDHPAARDDVLKEAVHDGLVIVDKRSAKVHHLNTTAAWVWSRLDGNRSRCEVARELIKAFDVEPEVAEEEFDQLIVSLLEQGLIVEKPRQLQEEI